VKLRAERLDAYRERAKARRDRNKAAGNCINDTLAGTHGQATHGVLCAKCRAAHRGGLEVIAADDFDPAADAVVNAAIDRELASN